MQQAFKSEHEVRQYVQYLKNFYGELSSYVFVITLALIVWLLSGGGYFWPMWIILIWGISLFLKASRLHVIGNQYYEAAHLLRERLPFIKPHWQEEKVNEILKNLRIPASIENDGKKINFRNKKGK